MAKYLREVEVGLDAVKSYGDGYTFNLKWFQAYPDDYTKQIAYNIYFSTDRYSVFSDGPKFISIDGSTNVDLIDFEPGGLYFFSLRPIEYDSAIYDLSTLPDAPNGLKLYPNSILRADITETDLIVPLLDAEGFPNTGIVKVGVELINYSSVDLLNNDLIVASLDDRGYNNTPITYHLTDGYDGYHFQDTTIRIFILDEDLRYDRIFQCQNRYEFSNYPWTINDGYRSRNFDIITTDMSVSDAENADFPSFPFAGYLRISPADIINGSCQGLYFGGPAQISCADGYDSVGGALRGLDLQDINTQRQEVLFDTTGEPVTLINRSWTGVTCACFIASRESPQDRCPLCHGTGITVGYTQYFSPKRSDGKIMVRIGPYEDDVKSLEPGFESDNMFDVRTLVVPTIKDRDILVRYDRAGNEAYRMEVLSVNRNNTVLGQFGAQILKAQRIRKTDPAYQIRIFRDSSSFPTTIQTSVEFVSGLGAHSHDIVVSEKTLDATMINQTTSISSGHNHSVVNGIVLTAAGHTHDIVFP